jgi:hypothetical protein
MKKVRFLKTINDVKELEHISDLCSEKYVQIKTTDFINALTSFNFKGGHRYRKGSTAHFVVLDSGNDIKLVIDNSFDRTLSLRISFDIHGFRFGRIKQKHLGKPAEELNEVKTNINDWFNGAVKTVDSMRNLQLPKDDLKEIARVGLKARGINIRDVHGVNYNYTNVLDFVLNFVQDIKDGNFYRMSKNKIKVIKPVTRESSLVKINDEIWKFLIKNNPELQI